jgi:glycosyltransferase involved in cell wall biosynthesis
MRVLIVADVVGGVRTFVAELTQALADLGVEVHLALLGRGAPTSAAAAAASCQVRDLKLEWMDDPWADIKATSDWIEALRERYRPDVIHMNTFAPVRDVELPVVLTVHSCVLSWWRAVQGKEAPSSWGRYWWLVRQAFDRADVMAAPTRALLDEMACVYGDLPPARVIPNGRALAKRPAAIRREALVVSAGRLWDEAKNAAMIGDAAPAIGGRVVLIGPGAVAGVETVGELTSDEVTGWMRRAAVFAAPARYEPFGLAALEAALCGCALVLGDIPSLREVWHDAASYVAPDDPDALAHAVNGLLDNPTRRRNAARAARARAARYTPGTMARAYLDAYREPARTTNAA